MSIPSAGSSAGGGRSDTLPPRGGGRRIFTACISAFLLGSNAGCYVYTPAVTPVQGMRVQLELTDRGRVGMGGSIGAAARTIEGTLTSNPDSSYALRVEQVQYLNGQSNRWTGEAVNVSKDFVGTVKERQFSRSRTFIAAAAIIGGTAVLIATRGLDACGSGVG